MKKINFAIGLIAGLITIIAFFVPSPTNGDNTEYTGINGSNNKNITIVQNSENININGGSPASKSQQQCEGG